MPSRLVAGTAALVIVASLSLGCSLGSDDDTDGVPPRAGVIPTATLPPSLPEPMLLGQTSVSAGTTPAAGSGGSYTVKSGDTLFDIAAALGIPAEQRGAWSAEVLRLNAIADAALLAAGQELRLPAQPARATGTPATGTPPRTSTPAGTAATATPQPATTATRSPATPTATAAQGGSGTYTVQAGDYPLLIAEKLGVPAAQQLAWANELTVLNNINPNAMVVGTVLRLPAGTPGR